MASKLNSFYHNNPLLAGVISALIGPVAIIATYCLLGGTFR